MGGEAILLLCPCSDVAMFHGFFFLWLQIKACHMEHVGD